MTKLVAPLLVSAGLLSLTACADGTESRPPQSRAPAVEVIGDPVNCINTNRIRNTRVHDDFTIDFRLSGNELFRNTLRGRCPQLGLERRFAYRGNSGRICSLDTITVIQAGGTPGARCALGQFVPVRLIQGSAESVDSNDGTESTEGESS